MNIPIHIIKKVRGSHLPQLCVAMAVHYGDASESPTVALCVAHFRSGSIRRQTVETGGWQWALATLATLCRRGASVWLVSRDLYESLTRIRFFTALTQGLFRLARGGPKRARSQLRRRAERGKPPPEDDETGPGILVHEPGCCYLIASRSGGGRLTCVDPINYGVRSLPGWSEYPTANAELLMTWWADWLAWLHEHEAGSLRLTLASQSHYCYRRRFMRHDIVVHGIIDALALESAALHGGRCEAYHIGELPGPIYHLDARSLYGAMASQYEVPVSLLAYGESDQMPANALGQGVVADVTVSLDTPCLPYRGQLLTGVEAGLPANGNPGISVKPTTLPITVYPTGVFRTQICGPELSMTEGRIIKVHRWAVYRMAPAFKTWARWNYARRREAAYQQRTILESMLKQWSQYCYGRWAMRYRGWLSDSKGTAIEPWELWWQWDAEQGRAVPHRSIAGRPEVYEDRGLSPSACPVITAWIHSLARRWLEGAIVNAGREHCYYVDTDSLFVDQAGLSRLTCAGFVVGDGLGDLRTIGRHMRVVVHGWKHYECDGILTCAGIPLSRRGGYLDQVAGEAAEPLTVAAYSGRPPQEVAPLKQWHRSPLYRHGRVQADGRVLPHHLGDR